MIAPLSGCDLFVLPVKLITLHIIVKAWHWKTEADDSCSDYMAQWWHRLARVPLHRSLSYENRGVFRGRGVGGGCFIVQPFDWVAKCQDYQPMPSARVLHPQSWIDWDLLHRMIKVVAAQSIWGRVMLWTHISFLFNDKKGWQSHGGPAAQRDKSLEGFTGAGCVQNRTSICLG